MKTNASWSALAALCAVAGAVPSLKPAHSNDTFNVAGRDTPPGDLLDAASLAKAAEEVERVSSSTTSSGGAAFNAASSTAVNVADTIVSASKSDDAGLAQVVPTLEAASLQEDADQVGSALPGVADLGSPVGLPAILPAPANIAGSGADDGSDSPVGPAAAVVGGPRPLFAPVGSMISSAGVAGGPRPAVAGQASGPAQAFGFGIAPGVASDSTFTCLPW